MELIGKLKDKMAQAKDKDEAKEIMENAGMKLTDDELDVVAGGMGVSLGEDAARYKHDPHSGIDKNSSAWQKEIYERWIADGCPSSLLK